MFEPSNHFEFSTVVRPSSEDHVKLLKFLNLYYLGDEDANQLLDGVMVPKHLEKETEEFKNAVRNVNTGFPVTLSITVDVNGNFKCEVIEELSLSTPRAPFEVL